MESQSGPDMPPLRLVLIFFALALCLGLAGYLAYSGQSRHIRRTAEDQLSAVAELKVKQVASWRRQQFEDASVFIKTPALASGIAAWTGSGDPRLKRDILSWMQAVRAGRRYKAFLLLDPGGRALLADPPGQDGIGPDGVRLVREAAASGTIILSDLYQSRIVPETRCSLLIPVPGRSSSGASQAAAVLLARIDPSWFLYPLIQTWPGASSSAETLLLRRENNEAVLLNETRHRKQVAHSLRVPLTGKPGLTALLDRGEKGVIDTNDYRNVPVIAAIQPVPDSPWFLVAKVDREEIYAPLRRQAIFLAVVVLTLITAAGLIIFLWWRRYLSEQGRRHIATELALKSLTARYDYLSKYANDIVVICDRDGKIIDANDRAVAAYGYYREELLRLCVRDLLPPAKRDGMTSTMQKIAASEGLLFESVNRRRDGAVFPVEVSSRVVEADGELLYLNILRDISDRKAAEQTIRHLAGLYTFLGQVNQAIVRASDRDRLFTNICRIAVEFGGFQAAWIGISGAENGSYAVPAASWGVGNAALQRLVLAGQSRDDAPPPDAARGEGAHYISNDVGGDPSPGLRRETLTREGYRSWGAFPIRQCDAVIGALHVYSGEPGFFRDAEIKLLDEVALDISFALDNLEREQRRKNAEQALKAHTAFIEAILDNLPLGLAANRLSDGAQLYMNKAFESIYGWPKEKLTSVETFFACVYPDPVRRENMRARVLADIASADPDRMRWEDVGITTERGEERRVTAINIPLPGQDMMISTVQDITLRHDAEQALLESRRRFERLVESVTDYIYTVRIENGRILSTTHGPACLSVTGYTSEEYEADPGLWLRMVFEEDRNLVVERSRLIASGTPVEPFEHRLIHKNGSLRWVRNTPVLRYDRAGRVAAYDGLITDITALRTLENQLRQAQKMEAVGQLAGGVAHDFNNILTAIIGYANLLLMKTPGNDGSRTFVEQILSSAERAGHLTHSLLTFSRKQIIELKPIELNDVIKRVDKLLARVIGEDIEFRTLLDRGGIIILADSIQIEQVLMNLATNARDAMPLGGVLQIETAVVELSEDFVRRHSYAKPGTYGLISVTDTGMGMDEAVKRRIFEPFFTTKAMGKGTGLGLAMVYGIVKQHNGYIHVYSEPKQGTTFKIYLPVCATCVDATPPPRAEALVGGNETILLVEDDGSVREMTKKVLEDFGYRVLEAADGEEAVRMFKENREAVNMLVLDIIMPKKNGRETYEEIRAIKPGIKALFTSGYTADIIEQKGIIDTGQAFVAKPSEPAVLLRKVRDILNGK